jgi:hypothetical protein
MRIHSDTLDLVDMHVAAKVAGVQIIDLSEHGSRSRVRAFSWTLSGSGSYRSQYRNSDHKAATWDEWGIFFAHLFNVDPLAHTGKWPYLSGVHFDWSTGGRYRTLTPSQQHLRHKWNPLGSDATGKFYAYECACGAYQRQMTGSHDFAELAS